MASPKSKIRATLTARLIGYTPALQIAWEGKTFNPTIGVPYLAPALMPAQPRQAGLGDEAMNEHTGIYQIMLSFPSNKGVGDINQAADGLVDWFKRGTQLDAQVGTLKITKSWSGPETTGPDWITIPVSVAYSLFTSN